MEYENPTYIVPSIKWLQNLLLRGVTGNMALIQACILAVKSRKLIPTRRMLHINRSILCSTESHDSALPYGLQ